MDSTSVCQTQNEYFSDASSTLPVGTLTTSTVSCYKPIDVQIFYLLDFVFFAVILTLCIVGIRKIIKD